MRLERPFEVVTPTLDGLVLQTLACARVVFSTAEIVRLNPDYSRSGVTKVLDRLVEQGIVRRHRVGNVNGYSLNRSHLAAEAILLLTTTKQRFVDRLRGEIAGWPVPPVAAFLFGSAARGDMRQDSDIDILVVGPGGLGDNALWEASLSSLGDEVEEWTGNPLQLMEMTVGEVRKKSRAEDPFLKNVETDGIQLAGPPGYWRSVERGEDPLHRT